MLQNVSVVWWFMFIFTICNVYASKWLRQVPFSFFLWLEHGKTWFGRCFCCLVIYANLRKMPKFTMHGKIKQTWEIGKNNKKRVQSTAETNLEHRHQPNYSCVGGLCSKTMCGRPLVDIFNFWVSHFGRSGDILSFSQLLYIYTCIFTYITYDRPDGVGTERYDMHVTFHHEYRWTTPPDAQCRIPYPSGIPLEAH